MTMSTATLRSKGGWRAAAFVVLAALLLWDIGAAHAQRFVQSYRNAHTSSRILDRKVDPKLSPAARARAQKLAAVKKKHQTQDFIQGVVEEEQQKSAPDANGKGGAQ